MRIPIVGILDIAEPLALLELVPHHETMRQYDINCR